MDLIVSLIINVAVALGAPTTETSQPEIKQISTADGPRYIVTDGN